MLVNRASFSTHYFFFFVPFLIAPLAFSSFSSSSSKVLISKSWYFRGRRDFLVLVDLARVCKEEEGV